MIHFSVRAFGAAANDECRIDIHGLASLQPQATLIRVFVQSFICRAKQACRPHEHALTHTLAYTAYVNSERNGFFVRDYVIYSDLEPVSRCECLSICGEKVCADFQHPMLFLGYLQAPDC